MSFFVSFHHLNYLENCQRWGIKLVFRGVVNIIKQNLSIFTGKKRWCSSFSWLFSDPPLSPRQQRLELARMALAYIQSDVIAESDLDRMCFVGDCNYIEVTRVLKHPDDAVRMMTSLFSVTSIVSTSSVAREGDYSPLDRPTDQNAEYGKVHLRLIFALSFL